jgi:hypothetical protein
MYEFAWFHCIRDIVLDAIADHPVRKSSPRTYCDSLLGLG